MPVKAYIYAEDGALLGYMAYQDVPPDVLDLNGRYFEQHGRSSENQDDDDCNVQCFDYWEIEIEKHMDVIYICVGLRSTARLVSRSFIQETQTLSETEYEYAARVKGVLCNASTSITITRSANSRQEGTSETCVLAII
jgi:hypothetical protein